MAHSKPFGRIVSILLGVSLPGFAQGFLGLSDPAEILPAGSFSVQACAFALSDPVPIHGMINRWQGGFEDSAHPLVVGAWGGRTQAVLAAWKVALWDRTSFLGQLSPGAARLLWLTKQKLTLPKGELFVLDIEADALHRTGASVGRAWRLGNLELGADLNYWTATGAQFGSVRGAGAATGSKAYTFDANVDYQYNQNRLYELSVPSERGQGFGLDLGAAWIWQAWEGRCAVRDLGNQTHWERLPMTTATAVSSRSHTDASGYLTFDPTIEGWEGERPLTWREPVAWTASLARSFGDWTGRARMERVGPLVLRSLEWEWKALAGPRATVGFEERNHVWTAGLSARHAWLKLGMTTLSTNRTRGLLLDMGVKGQW